MKNLFLGVFALSVVIESGPAVAQSDLNNLMQGFGNMMNKMQQQMEQKREDAPHHKPAASPPPPTKKQVTPSTQNVEPAINPIEEKYMYAKTGVSVRSGPSTSTNKISKLSTGQKVTVIGEKSGSPWVKIIYDGDKTGFVSSDYLSENLVTQKKTAPSSGSSGSLLGNYDSTPASKSMSCWTGGQSGWKTYQIRGKNIWVDQHNLGEPKEQKGSVYATQISSMIGPVTIIIDYSRKRVTQRSVAGNEEFKCK